jgi:membrane fusion protein (multidrug efflux system)
MLKKFLLMLGAVIAVWLTLFFIKKHQITQAMAMGAKFAPPPPAVATFTVENKKWQPVLSSVGTIEAVQGVLVATDLPGIVQEIAFESGKPVKKGDVLLKLDTRQEEAQLNASRARLELGLANLNRNAELLKKRVAAQSDYDSTAAEYKQAVASVKEIEALIDRKTIRAPFDGILGIRLVNLGQYMKSGDEIVPLQSLDPIYVDFSTPQQNLAELVVGRSVRVHADGLPGEFFEGKITAIDPNVDTATRNIRVQATLSNPGEKLRSGMFVRTDVMLPERGEVLAIPASAVDYAPFGNSVYVVKELTDKDGKSYTGVQQQFVKLGSSRGDLVEVTSGLQAGDQVVTGGTFKLRNKQEVVVNNDVQVSSDPQPNPADS